MSQLLRVAALLLCPLALTGCPSGPDMVEPIYEIDPDDSVVVLPFKDPDFGNRWDSALGHQLAEVSTVLLSNNADFTVIPYRKVLELYAAEKKDVRDMTPRDVAAVTDADYVVVVDVARWDPMEVKGVGITQSNARGSARLFKVDRKRSKRDEEEAEARVAAQNKARKEIGLEEIRRERGGDYVCTADISARYPDTFLEQEGETFLDPDEANIGLIRALAREAAQLFYEHEEPYKKHHGR